jgi:hypothetical protein
MKVSKDLIMREIAGEHILVPVGAAAAKFNGLITMNDVGRFIFGLLSEDRTLPELAKQVTAEYDVDYDTALRDAEEFVRQLRDVGALEE